MRFGFGIVFLAIIPLVHLSSQAAITKHDDAIKYFAQEFGCYGLSAGNLIIYNGLLPLLGRELNILELGRLDKKELWLLRNTIYAQYGYKFKSDVLSKHFSQFDWYKPTSDNVDKKMTFYDSLNIRNTKKFEDGIQASGKKIKKENLYGKWVSGWGPMPDAGFPEINFYKDGTVELFFTYKGTFDVEDGLLLIRVTEQSLNIGRYFSTGYGSSPYGEMYGHGVRGIIKYDPPIIAKIPLGDGEEWATAEGEHSVSSAGLNKSNADFIDFGGQFAIRHK
jgi:hypothetical protein